MKNKIAVVVSHPIQHFCPQYRSWATNKNVNLKVFFGSIIGSQKYIDPNFKREISWNNLYLNEFEHHFLNGDLALPADDKVDAPSLANDLDEYKPDAIIVYGYFQKISRRAIKWARKRQVTILYISDAESRQTRFGIKELLRKVYLQNALSKIDYCLTVGDANEAYYKNYGVAEKKFIRMHFPIDIYNYEKAYNNKAQLASKIKEQYQINSKTIVISVVGKLVSWKNQNHIIQALQMLEAVDQEYRYVAFIAGSGAMEDEWKISASNSLTTNRAIFTGFVTPEQLIEYYAATDVYVHPAQIEPHSLAISEAIYMGCIPVVSNTTGSWGDTDDVQQSKNGYVYEFGNIEQLVSCIIKAKDEKKRALYAAYSVSLGRAHQQQSHFGVMDKIVHKLLSK